MKNSRKYGGGIDLMQLADVEIGGINNPPPPFPSGIMVQLVNSDGFWPIQEIE